MKHVPARKSAVHCRIRYLKRVREDADGRKLHDYRLIKCKHCRGRELAGKPVCGVCGHAEGCTDDYGGDGPMGPIEKCPLCRRWRCPVCASECECCLEDWEDKLHADPKWAPRGWTISPTGNHRMNAEGKRLFRAAHPHPAPEVKR